MKKHIDKIKEILKKSTFDQLRAHWIISKTENLWAGAFIRNMIMLELEKRDPEKFEIWLQDDKSDFTIFKK